MVVNLVQDPELVPLQCNSRIRKSLEKYFFLPLNPWQQL